MPKKNSTGVVIWEKGDEQDWTKGSYLIFGLYGDNEFSGVINVEFFKETGEYTTEELIVQGGEVTGRGDAAPPWISSLMGILPNLKTQVVFPLSYLDAQEIFLPRFPRQLKGTVTGNRLDPADIVKVVLRFGPYDEPYLTPEFELAAISINKDLPEPYPLLEEPVIDEFGQWKSRTWEGKIEDSSELAKQNAQLYEMAQKATLPDNWSKYGGWLEKRFEATGFFRTQHDEDRWWLVDPEGNAFLSVGVDVMRYGSSGPINDSEDLFEWLPKNGDSTFGAAIDKSDGREMDFYKANMIKAFGKNPKEKWATIAKGLMSKYRFNTVGNWSDLEFIQENQLPYVLPLQDFPSTEVRLYRDFPDVFSKEFQENSEKFAEQLHDFKDDPYMIGYFLRNEPQWAFGYHNLAYEMFGTDQHSETKSEFINWISRKYNGDIEAFNKNWQLDLQEFEELSSQTFKEYPSETADSDFYEFSEIMVARYVDVPCDEVEKIDNNHLNLGMRYAWISSDLLYKAGERFDVFSINGYGIKPPETNEIAEISGKPIMIGEFHHGAIDRALPATGITGVFTQEDRGKAYRNYVEEGFSRPELIGMHYFQWIDQPIYGRFDGENYNIGVVDMNNLPYPELTEAMTITNERIYRIGTDEVEPYKGEIKRINPIHY
ncbi:hypothetical protein [Zunongwangia sp. H14]|uniref:hypothetical protein n=1 Tax=Zunongwangia sp. H14 TaxID=3240792 RepID=UPI00356B1D46